MTKVNDIHQVYSETVISQQPVQIQREMGI